MDGLPMFISRITGAAGRLGGTATEIFQDRLELLALELREAKIRFIQAVLLVCMAVVFSLLGLLLLVLAGMYVLPPESRLYGVIAAAAISMLAGSAAYFTLLRHLQRKPLAFDQSLAELKKDATCFSTKN
ncbi:phage holin family protein [Desulfofustis limnaeus]|uniref:Phage holin family protein n=1 Tax=Desulfofustis limnaeus TaxID=2740163 RepID=A0ABN6M8E6_9BACT|nr:phage holin family protein [Desulfofustis limnaeus]BDD87853.1 hypothetical protein DPPLL_22180 [Desulfofustis limnaeus]